MNIVEEFGLNEDDFIWQDMAMCVGMGQTNIYFEDADNNPAIAKAAKSVCNYCPVKEMCLLYGQETKSTGIFGGRHLAGGKIND